MIKNGLEIKYPHLYEHYNLKRISEQEAERYWLKYHRIINKEYDNMLSIISYRNGIGDNKFIHAT